MADDHTLVLEAIGKLLEKEFDLVGTVGDGHALLQAAKQLRPDVILLDISMPLLNGIDACRQLVQLIPARWSVRLSCKVVSRLRTIYRYRICDERQHLCNSAHSLGTICFAFG
jgi:DNA-binding NarL/FixJ family response regulator